MKRKNFSRRGACLSLLLVLALLFALALPVGAANDERARQYVYVGGVPFGVRYVTDGILVVGFCDVMTANGAKNPAKEAGVRPGDCILAVNGKKPEGARGLLEMINEGRGATLTLTLRREQNELQLTLLPVLCQADGHARAGLWVRDSGAGLGTITYIEENNRFAGLGHGICDGECGALVPLGRGSVMGVEIGSVARGMAGAPGELKGHFTSGKLGTLTKNTTCGVYGVLSDLPAGVGERLPVGHREELHSGAAACICTLDDNQPHTYSIEISDIHTAARDNKCFTVTVTDRELLQRTGGIVQGMSGSPIIQDGKLVGAITHVLIGDPTTGYGIFIENMLAQMGDLAG